MAVSLSAKLFYEVESPRTRGDVVPEAIRHLEGGRAQGKLAITV